uniref:RNA polymerase subunit sigma-70 n=1 Tax=Enterocloster clostridioformis TaxID=1531 RepID=UPI0025A52D91|nr:RNA polymerase subunit sigma-70 [Enterocloster clostridioformis]
MTNDQKEKIAELRAAGFGYANIASALGLTKNQVVSYCHRNGLTGEKATKKAAGRPDVGICRNCGKPVVQVPGRKQVKFCSDDCCQSWWNKHPEAVNRKAIYSFTCACCGKPFTAYGNRNRKYCSHACYIAGRFGGDGRE